MEFKTNKPLLSALAVCISLIPSITAVGTLPDVPIISIMPDGYFNISLQYALIYNISTMTVDRTVNGNYAFTICMWIHPHRYRQTQKILDVSWHLFIALLEEYLSVILLPSCQENFKNVKIPLWEWTHFCIVGSDVYQFYINENLMNTSCKSQGNLNQSLSYMFLGDRGPETFSGKIGDFRFYPRVLSKAEMYSVSRLSLENTPEYLSFGFNSSALERYDIRKEEDKKTSIGIQPYIISSKDFLKPIHNYSLVKFEQKHSYLRALTLCSRYGGELPSKLIPDLLAIVQDDRRIFLNLLTFWIHHGTANYSSITECQKAFNKMDEIVIQNVPCDNEKLNVICLQRKGISLRLLGLPFEENVFQPVKYRNFIYESKGINFRLRLDKHKLLLETVADQRLFGYSFVYREEDIIGRHPGMADKGPMFLTLTTCIDGQFTCGNGQCIPLNYVCNSRIDCVVDALDEAICQPGISPDQSYESQVSPKMIDQNQTLVGLKFIVERVGQLDATNDVIEITVTIGVSWKDPRLFFKYLSFHHENFIDKNVSRIYWKPNIELQDVISTDDDKFAFGENNELITASANETFDQISTVDGYQALLHRGANVTLTSEKTDTLSVICLMDLFLYPFDTQRCSLALAMQNRDNVIWDKDAIEASAGNVTVPLFGNLEFAAVIEKDSPQKITFKVSAARRYGAFVFSIFLPCVLLEVIGILSHFLPTNDYQDRVSITLSCLIVMAGLFTQVSSSLPSSASPKMIDIWMFAHVGLLSLIFAAQIVVIYFDDKRASSAADRSKNESWMAKAQISTTKLAWLDQVSATRNNTTYCVTPEMLNKIGLILCTIVYLLFLAGFIGTVAFYEDMLKKN